MLSSGSQGHPSAIPVPTPNAAPTNITDVPLVETSGAAVGSTGEQPAVADGATAAAPSASPADAWQAVLQLEAQLARAVNDQEPLAVRQASSVLRSMLSTLSHDCN